MRVANLHIFNLNYKVNNIKGNGFSFNFILDQRIKVISKNKYHNWESEF